jgi:hypothetical protein
VVNLAPLVEPRERVGEGEKTAGRSSGSGGGWVQGGCLDPAATGLHVGGALYLEAETTRRNRGPARPLA